MPQTHHLDAQLRTGGVASAVVVPAVAAVGKGALCAVVGDMTGAAAVVRADTADSVEAGVAAAAACLHGPRCPPCGQLLRC